MAGETEAQLAIRDARLRKAEAIAQNIQTDLALGNENIRSQTIINDPAVSRETIDDQVNRHRTALKAAKLSNNQLDLVNKGFFNGQDAELTQTRASTERKIVQAESQIQQLNIRSGSADINDLFNPSEIIDEEGNVVRPPDPPPATQPQPQDIGLPDGPEDNPRTAFGSNQAPPVPPVDVVPIDPIGDDTPPFETFKDDIESQGGSAPGKIEDSRIPDNLQLDPNDANTNTDDINPGQNPSEEDTPAVADPRTDSIQNANGGVEVPTAFTTEFESQSNLASEFGQLTYNIALYLQTPQQYASMVETGNKSTEGLKKILQSGGNNRDEEVIFPDLYIDEVEIQSLMQEQTQAAHNVLTMTFNIIEPFGYTFFKKLKQLCNSAGMTDFSKQHYLMVITYNGYDENGQEIQVEDKTRLTKFIPFLFTKINSRVATGGITYACEALASNHQIGLSAKRATIPFNVEIVGQSLKDMFNATSNASVVNDTGGREDGGVLNIPTLLQSVQQNPSGTKSQTVGIIDAINKQQQLLVANKQYSIPDRYKVTFEKGIGEAKIVSSSELTVKKSKAMAEPTSTNVIGLVTANLSYDKTRQIYSLPAGQQILQVLDIMLRSSDYITRQQTFIEDPKTGGLNPNPGQNEFLQWYHIGVKSKPIGWDDRRQDYAYEIEYIVSPKQISTVYSPFFNDAKFRGVHKEYNYWFTGENTEILSYEQELNTSFYVAMGSKIPQPKVDVGKQSERVTTKSYVNKQGSGGKGQPNDYGNPAEYAAEVVYSAVDFATFEMEIVGDPDYIQQGDVVTTSGKNFAAFLDDGSINYDNSEVLIKINFKTMEDYKEDGGVDLIEPLFIDGNGNGISGGLIYKVIQVSSRFSGGKFTHVLSGILREFPDQTNNQTSQREENAFTLGNALPGQLGVTFGQEIGAFGSFGFNGNLGINIPTINDITSQVLGSITESVLDNINFDINDVLDVFDTPSTPTTFGGITITSLGGPGGFS